MPANTDRIAIASLVCGLTAVIPVVSQVAGVGLGVWALVRIRRLRRAGGPVRGSWAAGAGIVLSAAALICWGLAIAALCWAGATFKEVSSQVPTPLSDM
ncbi:MAG: DUF4190 domain-containing protein [Planctomycetota bacterium]